MSQALRLLLDGPGRGSWNMALDEALATAPRAPSMLTLRLYDWNPPAVSLGRHQAVEEIDLPRMEARGYHLVRRPTGGTAVLHRRELTFALAGPEGAWGSLRLSRAVTLLARALVGALRSCGIPATVSGGGEAEGSGARRPSVACFAGAGRDEVWVGERKLAGLAGRRWRGAFLVHGSLLLRPGHLELADLLSRSAGDREAFRRELERRTVSLQELATDPPPWEVLARGLGREAGALLGQRALLGMLTPREGEWARELERTRHASADWILAAREPETCHIQGAERPADEGIRQAGKPGVP